MSKHSEAVAAHAREMGHGHVRSSHEPGHSTHSTHHEVHELDAHPDLGRPLHESAPTMDSPVPKGTQRPHYGDTAKAAAVGREIEDIGDKFHPDGVMHR